MSNTTIGHLNVGNMVYDPLTYSGEIQGGTDGFHDASHCQRWIIIGKNIDGNNTVTLMNEKGILFWNYYFDYKEETNPIADRAQDGYSRYSMSNIFQALNSDVASNWYTPKHTYDAVNDLDNREPGALYTFSSNLKSLLKTFSKPVAKPSNDGGGVESVSGKVHLLSENEITGAGLSTEGSQYPFFQNLSTTIHLTGSRSAKNDNGTISDHEIIRYIYKNYSGFQKTDDKANSVQNPNAIIVVPDTIKISDWGKYKDTPISTNSGQYYAMLNMPLAVEIETRQSIYKNEVVRAVLNIIDEEHNNLTLKVYRDTNTEVFSKTIQKSGLNEIVLFEDDSAANWELYESHTYTYEITNSDNETISYTYTYRRNNYYPDIQIFDESTQSYKTSITLGELTKSPTVNFLVSDSDIDVDEQVYVYVSERNFLAKNYKIEYVGTYTTFDNDTVKIPIEFWKQLPDSSSNEYIYLIATNVEWDGETAQYNNKCASIYCRKSTPAPYITVESTNIGRKNIGFTVKYTPRIDTDYTITKVEIYVDNILKDTVNTPVPGNELAYEITKAALYDMTLGNHTITFRVYDDLGQNTATNVAFTRYNDAPNIIATQSLGNKNLGFSSEFSVSDTESDTMNVRVYVDDVTSTPIFSQDDVPTGSRLLYEVTKAKLYTLSLGQHTIKIVATDAYDSTTVNATFTRTNNAPVVNASQETSVHYENFDVTYTVTDAEQDSTNLVFKIGSSTIGTVTDVPLGVEQTRTIDISGLGYGSKTLSIVATDSQGKTSTKTMQFTISSVPVITAPEIGKKSEPFTGTFKVDDPDGDSLYVKVTLDSDIGLLELNNAPHNQNITYAVSDQIFNELSLGHHSITIFLKDVDQNVVTKVLDFTVASMPVIEIDTPLPASITKPLSVNVRVSDEDGDTVTVKAYIDSTEIPVEEED